jgi:hypothetical protein
VAVTPTNLRQDRDIARNLAFFEHAMTRAHSLPGVEAVAMAAMAPFDYNHDPETVARDGRHVDVHLNLTSPEFFDTVGLRLVRGRIFTADEARHATPVIVISAALARDLWGDSDPIGQWLDHVGRQRVQVIGVVGDAILSWRYPNARMIYKPLETHRPLGRAQLVIRTTDNAALVLPALKTAVKSVDPTLGLTWMLSAENAQNQLGGGRILAIVTGMLGSLALVLAVVGMFGVTACAVNQRLGEVSIRMAVGATGADILALLLRDSLRPVAIGLAAGLLIALVDAQGLTPALHGVSPRDPIALGVTVVILVAASTAAVLIPTRRAARVDPARILRA